jgi:alpha-2-macroglobulin
MSSEPGRRRISLERATTRRAGLAFGALAVLTAVIGTALLTTPPHLLRGPSDRIADATAGLTPDPEPSLADGDWADLELPPFEPVAELTAADSDRLGIASDTTFRFRSLDGTPARDLAAGLRIDPPVKLRVAAGDTPDTAVIRPVEALAEGIRYRFRLEAADGSLAGSWAYVTRSALRVVGTLPGDRSVGVPTNTGIEVTFDQDGTRGFRDRFAIKPAVAGRFENHGRTWAFVPEERLAPATIYTVTIRSGVGVEGSSETLESNVVFRFETAVKRSDGTRIEFGRELLESRADVSVDVGVEIFGADRDEEGGDIPDSVVVEIHRLRSFAALVEAATKLAGPNGWAVAAPSATVATSDLEKVAELDSPIVETFGGWMLVVPAKLAAGAYVLTIRQPDPASGAGAPAQLLLQVTNLSAYALTATGESIVWVNDLATAASLEDAAVRLAGGDALGRTDSDGVLKFATRPELLSRQGEVQDYEQDLYVPPPAHLLTVTAADGRRLLVPVGLPVSWAYGNDLASNYAAPSNPWWLLFHTDRQAFRPTDTVHVYGTIRARDDRSVPQDLEVRLRPAGSERSAPILRITPEATSRGVFTGALRLRDLPRGSYEIDLYAGDRHVANLQIRVTEIRKPAYSIAVESDRHVYLDGQDVAASAVATFYDGTVVPGMDLAFSGMEQRKADTTDAAGASSVRLSARFTGDDDQREPDGWAAHDVSVRPVNPEEGLIGGNASFLVLPSRYWLAATGALDGARIVAKGRLTWADIAGMEADVERGREVDAASGAPIGGGSVRATVIHLVPVRTRIGTTYDFIEKTMVPLYEYDTREVQIASRTLTSTDDGDFRLSLDAPVAADSYRVRFTASDPEGRQFVQEVYVASPRGQDDATLPPYLGASSGGCGYVPATRVGIGEPVNLTMHNGDGSVVADGRLLFIVGRQGSLETIVQDDATLARALRNADLPGFTVGAVWLSGAGYQTGRAQALVDLDEKRLTVRLQPDRARYRPGEHVSIAVTTTDSTGRPLAADVVVSGIDEKLYTLGLAYDSEPVEELMAPTDAGFYQSYRTHGFPVTRGDGCGDTGGDDRDNFKDVVTFQRITTNAEGRGSVSFDLSDDLTSWHMTATAVSGRLDAGIGSVLVPVGLPFFVEAVLAPEYLAGDVPVLRLRGYGEQLVAGDTVRFEVSAPSLGLAPTVVEGEAFKALGVALPAMTPGDHAVRIEAEGRHGDKRFRDVLVRNVHVVSRRLSTISTSYDLLGPDFTPRGADGLTTFTVTDAGRGRLLQLLNDLAGARSARLDRTVAAELARATLIEEYGVPGTALPATGLDVTRYQQQGGASLLPYSTSDLFLSALVALVAPDQVDAPALDSALRDWAEESRNPDLGINRERWIVALAGRAGLGSDVLAELRSVDRAGLTVDEQLWLALGFAAAGDESTARTIEREVLEASGQRLGPWVRLVGPSEAKTLDASGLLLLLAGRLGDPLAHDVARYLGDNPAKDRIFPLEQIGYIGAFLERLPRQAARFAWTVAGARHDATLEPGGAFTLVLTADQRSGLRLEPLEGELGVVTSWLDVDAPLPSNASIAVAREVTPDASAPSDRLVRVSITVRFPEQAPKGCYRLTDLLPSGLAPVASGGLEYEDDEGEIIDRTDNAPYEAEGQRVSWCASPDDRSHVYSYAARVVSPGEYLWEPAVIQLELAPELGNATGATRYEIR